MGCPFKLRDHQQKALAKMHNGCILCGGTGSGKSVTSLAYYFKGCGGQVIPTIGKMKNPKDLYVITTARKRDSGEWLGDMSHFSISPYEECTPYKMKVVIDSWNNIKKYDEVTNAFFIFDEQRVVGYGSWTKSFLKIAKNNEWILLSATPGDTYSDYMPVFIANGFYKNKTEFTREHCVYSRYSKFPQIERYINTGRLNRLRRIVLVDMPYEKPAEQHHFDIFCDYDKLAYKELCRTRFNIDTGEPIENASEFCYELRKICNSDISRINFVLDMHKKVDRIIIFYNFDYELEALLNAPYDDGVVVAQWNGHIHEEVPRKCSRWIYLVQYAAGAEAWNCILTDTMIFYSQNYSYKMTTQAAGRIDRLTTPYRDLNYYHLKSKSGIDLAISKSLSEKKKFNETKFDKMGFA